MVCAAFRGLGVPSREKGSGPPLGVTDRELGGAIQLFHGGLDRAAFRPEWQLTSRITARRGRTSWR